MKRIENSECLHRFGQFIKDGRKQRDLLQEEVADMVGITQAYYSMIERGKREVDLVLAMRICQKLRLDIGDYIKDYL